MTVDVVEGEGVTVDEDGTTEGSDVVLGVDTTAEAVVEVGSAGEDVVDEAVDSVEGAGDDEGADELGGVVPSGLHVAPRPAIFLKLSEALPNNTSNFPELV